MKAIQVVETLEMKAIQVVEMKKEMEKKMKVGSSTS
jgi:hypothetical protein